MKAITNAHIVRPDYIIPHATILIDNNHIAAFGPIDSITIPKAAQVIDAQGNYVGPGFIDIHTHAGGDFWFYENPLKAAEHHVSHGSTSIFPALYFNLSKQEYLDAIQLLRDFSDEPGIGGSIKGLYMEGPYLNPKYGADQKNNKWVDPPDSRVYKDIIDAAGSFGKVWCVAPEREGIIEYVRQVKNINPQAVIAVAHSEATPQQIEALMPDGLCLATHHTNATGTLEKYPECRGVSVDETVNYFDEIYAELICDSMGIHVDPFMLRLIIKIKGNNRIILISDACSFHGPVPPGYDGVTDINFDDDGQIAGSKLTLDVACRNMMKHTGASITDVFRYASLNPARLLGMDSRGEIRVGNHADLIITDKEMNIDKVILDGNVFEL